ncbi:MAG: hypothetical protein RLZZ81_634 [Pseudomonadota bacterium]|jgi:hypothetical protein
MADDKDDAQVKNELGAIKAQLTATANPAELARLASAAAGLASSTNNPEILEQIKSVQAAIAKKEETAEQNISSKIAAENLGTQEQHDPEIVREQELHERHESFKASHAKLMQDASEYIEQKKQANENLQGLLNDLRDGKEISPERLQSFIKTPEQLREEHEKEQAIEKAQKQANQHYQEMQAREEELKKQRAESAKQAEEQRKTNEKLTGKELEQGQQKLAVLDNKTQQTDVKLAAIQPKVEDAKMMKDGWDKQADDLKKEKEKGKETEKEIQKEIEKHKEKNPEIYNQKYVQLDDFYSLIEGQSEAVKTGEIKDHELRNKFLNNENQPEIPIKFPPEIPPKPPIEIPSIIPDTKKPEIPIQAQSKQENVFEKVTSTLGDKILELKEKFNFKQVPKEELASTQQELRTGLQKQNPIPAKNNKETAINQHLNRINQQNKKNEGHTR